MKRLILLLALTACETTPPPQRTVLVDTVILKSTWIYCWERCGKKDQLASVSTTACVCSNGGVIPLQPRNPETSTKPTPEPSKSFMQELKDFFD